MVKYIYLIVRLSQYTKNPADKQDARRLDRKRAESIEWRAKSEAEDDGMRKDVMKTMEALKSVSTEEILCCCHAGSLTVDE